MKSVHTKKEEANLQELERLARKSGIRISVGKLIYAGLKLKGGQCLLREEPWLILDRAQPYEDQLELYRQAFKAMETKIDPRGLRDEIKAIVCQEPEGPLFSEPALASQENGQDPAQGTACEAEKLEPLGIGKLPKTSIEGAKDEPRGRGRPKGSKKVKGELKEGEEAYDIPAEGIAEGDLLEEKEDAREIEGSPMSEASPESSRSSEVSDTLEEPCQPKSIESFESPEKPHSGDQGAYKVPEAFEDYRSAEAFQATEANEANESEGEASGPNPSKEELLELGEQAKSQPLEPQQTLRPCQEETDDKLEQTLEAEKKT